MNYAYFLSAIAALLQYEDTNQPDFATIIQAIINDAEGRIYRELDFLATRMVSAATTVTANSRSFTLPATIISLQSFATITPVATQPANGTRNRVKLISKDALDMIWPTEKGTGATGVPRYGALQDDTTLLLAPTPDQAYVAECGGIFRPTPLSATNKTTYITINYPDLFLAACMVFGTGYQRDFGQQADDPKMALSWEAVYQSRKQSVLDQEGRRKGESTGGSPSAPVPITTPNPG